MFEELKGKWRSSIVARSSLAEFSGGLLNRKTMANRDALGTGVGRVYVGRKVVYQVDDLIAWMNANLQSSYKKSTINLNSNKGD